METRNVVGCTLAVAGILFVFTSLLANSTGAVVFVAAGLALTWIGTLFIKPSEDRTF